MLSFLFILISLFCGALAVANELDFTSFSIFYSLAMNVLAVLSFYAWTHLCHRHRTGVHKFFVWYSFLLYFILLVSFMLIDDLFLRNIGFDGDFVEYARAHTNLRPFQTIRLFWEAIDSHDLRLRYILLNLAGNLAAFAPLGYFLPNIFDRLRKFFPFLLAVTLIISALEFLQLVFRAGVCDVDDLILNSIGAAISFAICKGFGLFYGGANGTNRP